MLKKEGTEPGHEVVEGTFKREKVRYVARRVIVKLSPPKADVSLEEATDSVLSVADGAQIVRRPGKSGRIVLLIPEGEDVPTYAKNLMDSDAIAYAEPDVVDQAQVVPSDPRYSGQWAPPKVNAEAAWDLETGSNQVLIGIIDSGISMTGGALDHPDLSTSGRITLGTDFIDGGTPGDLNGHGTHVAGIAAAPGNNGAGIAGMNWNSPIYICRTLAANGNGSSADFADAVEEITDYALASGLKAVINYSAGGANNQTKQDAAQYASDNGMLLVAATGNDAGSVIWPAAYSTSITGVIAVGSTDANDTVSSFSNFGPEVTVVAPGSNILSTTPTYFVRQGLAQDYDTMDGTSMATPLVTGLAALMWSRHPGHTNEKIKKCLQDTAVNLGSGEFDNNWGHGRVDALAALKCGDVVAPITFVGTTCQSRLVKCPTDISICTTRITLCKSRLIPCVPKTSIYPCTHLKACPSRLPLLCPSTKLGKCWSKLVCVDPKTKLTACVEFRPPIQRSAVDACPSAPGGCPFDPGRFPINPMWRRIMKLELELEQLKQETWYEADAGEPQEGSRDWFYFDDDGEIHEV